MSPRTADLPSALENLNQIRKKSGSRRMAIFLDYDGTLTPIVKRPELATLPEQTRDTVRGLARKLTVGVISGRDLADVQRLVGIENIFYSGSHGYEIEGPDGWHLDFKEAAAFVPALDASERELSSALRNTSGAIVERKKYSVAVHYRLVDGSARETVNQAVEDTAGRHSNLRRSAGKMVYELQPRLDWNKGKALLWLLEALKLDAESVMPIFIGDDLTDEDAFDALFGRGVGIVVRDRDRDTKADYALDDPDEVRLFLERIAEAA